MLTREFLLHLGFTEIPHFTVGGVMIFDIGRNRHLSISSIGTPNEILFICHQDNNTITDLVCLHNYDYDGYLSETKLRRIISALTSSRG